MLKIKIRDNKPFTENIRWLFIGKTLTNVISLVISIFIVRKLAVSDFGIYSMFMGSLVIFSIFSINPILVSLKRFIPELVQKKYYSYLKTIITKLSFISFLLGCLLIVFVFLFRDEVGLLLNIRYFDNYYSLFIINIILYLIICIAGSILISLQEQKIISIINIIGVLVRGILYSIFLSRIDIILIFIIEASSQLVKSFSLTFFVVQKLKTFKQKEDFVIPKTERHQNLKRIKKFTFLSVANEAGAGVLSQYSDYYFISSFLGPTVLGLYAFAYKLLEAVFNWLPVAQISEIIKPFFIKKYYAEKESLKFLEKMFNFYIKIFLLLYSLIAIYLVSYQELINIYIFKSKYISTQDILIVILFSFVFRAITFPAGTIMEIKEKMGYLLFSKIFAVINIILVIGILTFTNYGILGIAVATTLSNIMKDIYLYLIIKKNVKIKTNLNGIIKLIIVLFFTGFVAIYFGYSLNNLIIRIIMPIFTSIITFIIAWRLLQPFDKYEREILDKIISILPARFNLISKILVLNS